jgi:hypothetical protein
MEQSKKGGSLSHLQAARDALAGRSEAFEASELAVVPEHGRRRLPSSLYVRWNAQGTAR